MIENFAAAGPSGEVRIVIRPNHSLSLRQLVGVVAVYAAVVMVISAFSWRQGNTLAPLFALLSATVFALCLALVWRRCSRAEVIVLDSEHVRVRRLPELDDMFDAHPAWVRVEQVSGKLAICSAGSRVEVGNWLVDAERAQLAGELARALGAARDGASAGRNF